ncbi:MAG: N-acetylmuramoyl-L-alanine amidase [Lachnospiraceae bacterium]|nr:N-acetylmuramoyl-L-alanine amidase [Lachnospiraceae bacterium]
MQPTIIIDAGHGGFDNGASFEGRREKNDTLRLALAVGERLEAAGFPVIFTRTADVYQSPINKATIANQSGGDFFVSIHRNSSGIPNQYNGVQTLVYSDSGVTGELARNINAELEQVGFNNINVEERKDLAVLRRTSMPAVLVEAGFINSVEDNRIFDDNFTAMANAIATAIENTVGVAQDVSMTDTGSRTRTNINGSSSSQRNNRLFGVQVGLFRRFENAQYRLEEMMEQGYFAQIIEWNGYYTVVVGQKSSLEDARELERELNRRGYETLIVNL